MSGVSGTLAARVVRTPAMVFGAYLDGMGYKAPADALAAALGSTLSMRVLPRPEEVLESVWPQPNSDPSVSGALEWSAESTALDADGEPISYGLQNPVPPAYARWAHPSGMTGTQLMLLGAGALFGVVATLFLEAMPGGPAARAEFLMEQSGRIHDRSAEMLRRSSAAWAKVGRAAANAQRDTKK